MSLNDMVGRIYTDSVLPNKVKVGAVVNNSLLEVVDIHEPSIVYTRPHWSLKE